MKKTITLALAVALLSVLNITAFAAGEENNPFNCAAELDIVSKYVWRGIPQGKTEAYEPSINFSKHGFTGNIWMNYSVDTPQQNKFSELDLLLSYELKLSALSVTPGVVLYTFPNFAPYGEAYVKMSYPVAFFKIVTDHYISALRGDIAGGYYGDAGLGYEKQLANDALWTSSALLGWGDAKFNSANYLTAQGARYNAGQLNVFILDTSITFKPYANGCVRPHLTYYSNLPAGIRNGMRAAGNAPNDLVIGIAAGYNF
ncbi:MAG: TorF family putative porin [Elusimicrobiaceae bacterium]